MVIGSEARAATLANDNNKTDFFKFGSFDVRG